MEKLSDKKCCAVIPARGGSKGVPGKNIKDIKKIFKTARNFFSNLLSFQKWFLAETLDKYHL